MSIYRYHSRLMVIAHSWQSNDPIDLTQDLVSVSTSKNIERVGSFSITLTARLNWLNRLFPNDMVNIYYDPGDGVSGWTRVMFGYVNRITRSEAVMDETGRISTVFTITGSDFMKAIDFTQIIFRPEMYQRADWKLDDRFVFNEIGGLGMVHRGVRGLGSPDVVVRSLLSGMMGFGAQWQVPPSYANSIASLASRNRRLSRALTAVSSDFLLTLETLGISALSNPATSGDAEIQKALDLLVQIQKEDEGIIEEDGPPQAEYLLDPKGRSDLFSILNAWSQIRSNSFVTFYDMLSTDFIEGKCIDGYADVAPIWVSQGALSNIMYRWSNREINELAFDLRPVVDGENAMYGDYGLDNLNQTGTLQYSRAKDEQGFNHGFGPHSSSVPGVKYVPAMIMRERPYSTATGLNVSEYKFGNRSPGVQYFGPVFSTPKQSTESSCRVLYDYSDVGMPQGITAAPKFYDKDAPPVKHMDVVTARLDEMTRMEVSRGDADMSNLIIFNNVMHYVNNKYNLPQFMPIFNLASIARDGVRLKEASTNYANFTRGPNNDPLADNLALVLIRWALLLDHWYQHNIEYLSGTITMRPRADIRVGYRLDIPERSESYYVTDVAHSWEKGSDGSVRGSTSLQVTRGQRNDPFPVYVPPSVSKGKKNIKITDVGATNGNRSKTGRLSKFFKAQNSISTTRAGIEPPADGLLDKDPPPEFGPLIPGGSSGGVDVKVGFGNKPKETK